MKLYEMPLLSPERLAYFRIVQLAACNVAVGLAGACTSWEFQWNSVYTWMFPCTISVMVVSHLILRWWAKRRGMHFITWAEWECWSLEAPKAWPLSLARNSMLAAFLLQFRFFEDFEMARAAGWKAIILAVCLLAAALTIVEHFSDLRPRLPWWLR